MRSEGRITIRGAGMHPYVWGKVRWSVWVLAVLWVLGAGGLELWFQPFPIVPGIIAVAIIGSLIYLSGRLLTSKHPFFPEVISTSVWRALRRAYYLHS
jgi:hypothetical protein